MSIYSELKEKLKEIIKKSGYEEESINLEPSNRRDLGEYQLNDAMQLAKKYHKSPREIADNIIKELEKDESFIDINIAGPGFINFSLSNKYIYNILNKMNDSVFNNVDKQEKKKILIDYGGANVAKALHVGHLRSANIGEALKRLANALGYEAIGDAHLGDYGRPLGFVITEIEKMYPDLPYFDENYTGNYEDIELPISNHDLETIYPTASQKAKDDPEYLERGRQITAKIQNGERGYYDLWKKIVDISKEDISNTYNLLNVQFEIWNGESDEMEYFEELKSIYEEKGLLKDSEGVKIIELADSDDKAPMPPLLFIKSNNTASYETTDLATILERSKTTKPEEVWYVVDGRQTLHFDQVFRAAKKGGISDNMKLEHIGFGTMNGKDGKPFKTRDGGVLSLKELINIVYQETYKKITNESIKEEEKETIAKQVAIATIKYADLLPFRGTDYIFEVEKFSDLEGKTGPYLLYSTIRMKSLLKKANYQKSSITKLKGATEKEIALVLLNLPLVLNKSIDTRSLNDICEYLYKITSLYNKFYSENRILTEEDQELKDSWLNLTNIVYTLNNTLLNILGITVPDKM